MAHNAHTLHFPNSKKPKVDLNACFANLWVPPGAAAVEMYPPNEDGFVGILVTEDVAERVTQTDAGIVIAENSVPDVFLGDVVLTIPYDGFWWQGFRAGDYQAKGLVKVYGSTSTNEFFHSFKPAGDSIVAKLKDNKVEAVGQWAFIRRKPLVTHQSGIEMIDSQKYRTCEAEIISAGSGWLRGRKDFVPSPYKPGDKIMYNNLAIVVDTMYAEDWVEGDPSDYAFIKQQDILMKVG